ncbi:hypothetical protein EAY27_19945 [Vibrio anguillarum]|nr:hypothetical protein [Vibrio anguillarum]MBF4279386.1 hypothetical protein [Vibrio anguillarum]MBF4299605.1 hypothetical protein [Vibrio anguillarum]MBF4361831.1 hypothetical protein [Vibrio anguillarum]MBF4399931.1 hypothetical protein [Vibrio anguillarum]
MKLNGAYNLLLLLHSSSLMSLEIIKEKLDKLEKNAIDRYGSSLWIFFIFNDIRCLFDGFYERMA